MNFTPQEMLWIIRRWYTIFISCFFLLPYRSLSPCQSHRGFETSPTARGNPTDLAGGHFRSTVNIMRRLRYRSNPNCHLRCTLPLIIGKQKGRSASAFLPFLEGFADLWIMNLPAALLRILNHRNKKKKSLLPNLLWESSPDIDTLPTILRWRSYHVACGVATPKIRRTLEIFLVSTDFRYCWEAYCPYSNLRVRSMGPTRKMNAGSKER